MQSSARHSSVPAAAQGWRPQRTPGVCCWSGCNVQSWNKHSTSFGNVHPGIDSPSHPRAFPRDRDQPHSHCSPVVGGKCHVRAIVEEHPDAAVGELVAKAVLVGIIHPLAHPHKVLMAGQGSWVFLRCWRREEVSRAASQPLSLSPPQGEQIPTAGSGTI